MTLIRAQFHIPPPQKKKTVRIRKSDATIRSSPCFSRGIRWRGGGGGERERAVSVGRLSHPSSAKKGKCWRLRLVVQSQRFLKNLCLILILLHYTYIDKRTHTLNSSFYFLFLQMCNTHTHAHLYTHIHRVSGGVITLGIWIIELSKT